VNPFTLLKVLPWVLDLVALAAAGFLFWRLTAVEQQMGSLKESNTQLSKAIEAKSAAVKDRAQVNQAVRKMAPAEKLEKLK
jgi:hypothetical protein